MMVLASVGVLNWCAGGRMAAWKCTQLPWIQCMQRKETSTRTGEHKHTHTRLRQFVNHVMRCILGHLCTPL